MKRWDAGDIGCGQFIIQLHSRIRDLQPGEALEILSRDPGVPSDLPAWCRMTGHTLVSAEPPIFVVRKAGT
jgi:tRNA 2-thiouridine synthesizing protein A